MLTQAILRSPGKSIIHGLTTAKLGTPNYEKAIIQHAEYARALKECGLEVLVLEADERYPDSTFIEDVALLTKNCAIITNPGAPSRRGETIAIKKIISDFYSNVEMVQLPGTVEAGDIMMVGSHFYIGLSQRTNTAGAHQIIAILEKYGFTGSMIRLKQALHLKTGLAYLEHNNLIACGEFVELPEFKQFNILEIDEEEKYAANCIWVNDRVLIPKGFPKACNTIKNAGYKIIDVDVSEFQKIDGGLSCLSLRF